MITTNPVRAFLNIIKYPDLRLNTIISLKNELTGISQK